MKEAQEQFAFASRSSRKELEGSSLSRQDLEIFRRHFEVVCERLSELGK